jgi:dUTP pyrophosphatase
LSYNLDISYKTNDDNNICKIEIKGCNILEFLHLIYNNSLYYSKFHKSEYNKLLYNYAPEYTNKFKYYKTNKIAIAPSKNSITDSGYDLHIIEKISQKNNLYMYDTGIIVEPPINIYFDLVPRSSIIKKGYMLANSIGIIDQTYRGSIKVALIKVDPDAKELELPLKLVQLIPRKVIQLDTEEVFKNTDLISTVRGVGGYGSTDKTVEKIIDKST